LALGATAGVLVVRKVTRTAQAFTPAGLAGRAGGLGESIRYFADQVRAGMAEREAELRDALGLDDDGQQGTGLPAEVAAQVIEKPTGDWRSGR
ncbi:MAG: DUF6167 family protein, partial [Nocardioides sp.]